MNLTRLLSLALITSCALAFNHPCTAGKRAQMSSEKIYPHLNKIYHKGWIDFNKNGKKDVYEDPAADVCLSVCLSTCSY